MDTEIQAKTCFIQNCDAQKFQCLVKNCWKPLATKDIFKVKLKKMVKTDKKKPSLLFNQVDLEKKQVRTFFK